MARAVFFCEKQAFLSYLLHSTFLPTLISLRTITSTYMPELTHSVFRPTGVGETCDKADGSLRLASNSEVIVLCKKSEKQSKKAVPSAAIGTHTGVASVMGLWKDRDLCAASAVLEKRNLKNGIGSCIAWRGEKTASKIPTQEQQDSNQTK